MDRFKRQELINKACASFRAKAQLPILTRTEMSLGNHSMMEHHL